MTGRLRRRKTEKDRNPSSSDTAGEGKIKSQAGLSFWNAFALLAIARLVAARYSNVQGTAYSSGFTKGTCLSVALVTRKNIDCDEVFNYWEPLHYWLFGRGMQTWEYAPAYAIRSWAYIMPHAFIMQVLETVFTSNRISLFFLMRAMLGVASAAIEAAFVTSISFYMGLQTASICLIFLAISPGMFISAVSFLPSTFAMYWVTAAFTVGLFLPPTRTKTWTVVFCIGIGALLGWPFAGALSLPFFLEMLSSSNNRLVSLCWMIESGILACIAILVNIFL